MIYLFFIGSWGACLSQTILMMIRAGWVMLVVVIVLAFTTAGCQNSEKPTLVHVSRYGKLKRKL